jgi:hypothetical protein
MAHNQRSRPTYRAFDGDVEAARPHYDQRLGAADTTNTRLQGLTKNVREVGRLVDDLEALHTGQLDCVTDEDKQRHNETVQVKSAPVVAAMVSWDSLVDVPTKLRCRLTPGKSTRK